MKEEILAFLNMYIPYSLLSSMHLNFFRDVLHSPSFAMFMWWGGMYAMFSSIMMMLFNGEILFLRS